MTQAYPILTTSIGLPTWMVNNFSRLIFCASTTFSNLFTNQRPGLYYIFYNVYFMFTFNQRCVSYFMKIKQEESGRLRGVRMVVMHELWFEQMELLMRRLSVSAVVMSYLQNPQPIIPPWAALISWSALYHECNEKWLNEWLISSQMIVSWAKQ